jgi:thiol-disulfide isomerase/thioredoxin
MSEYQPPALEKSSRPGGRWLLALFSVGLAIAMVAQLRAESERSETLQKGDSAPNFSMPLHRGGAVSLGALRGKVVMLDFWATWCPPCVEEMPSLVRLAREFEGRGLVFIAANRDAPTTAPAAVGVFDARRVPGVTAFTAFASDETTAAYRVSVLPTLYLIDRQGAVHRVFTGFTSEEKLRWELEEMLAP